MMLAEVLLGKEIEMDRDRTGLESVCRKLVAPPAISSCQSKDEAHDGVDTCTAPPRGLNEGPKYNTVRGYTQTDLNTGRGWTKNPDCPRSRVWIVYENGRAYPQYLIRYYRGEYDPRRVPYKTRPADSRRGKQPPEQVAPAPLAAQSYGWETKSEVVEGA